MMFASREELVDSLALFDRPERERAKGFLPKGADLDGLVDELFAPVEAAGARARGRSPA